MSSPATKTGLRPAQRRLLRLVASFEFTKGIFVLLIGLSAILLVHKDAWVIAESLLALLHISTDRHSAQLFLDFADDLTDARLWAGGATRLRLFRPSFCRSLRTVEATQVGGVVCLRLRNSADTPRNS